MPRKKSKAKTPQIYATGTGVQVTLTEETKQKAFAKDAMCKVKRVRDGYIFWTAEGQLKKV